MKKTLFSQDFLAITDLYAAYRKAKYESFRSSNCAQGQKFAEFEQRLEFNLNLLLDKLQAPKADWFANQKFLGRATCIPKSVTPQEHIGSHFTLTDPIKEWTRLHKKKKAHAEFRPVIDASVEFQIISALWIIKAGQDYDSCLDIRVAVGNRLRRWRAPKNSAPGAMGSFNERSHSLFRPYYPAYGAWRENGLRAMKEGLSEGKHIVAVTMDLKRFYHQVDPEFLLHPDYLQKVGVVLDINQKLLTKQIIQAIDTWNIYAAKLTGEKQYGLPVGLTASSVIANVLLQEFDSGMQRLQPIYYGRYVDDIFLVLDHKGFPNSNKLMQWLAKQLGQISSYEEEKDKERSPILRIAFPYGGRSQLLFMGKKQKVFQLEGQHGIDLINPIEEQIRRQRSEHQGLPDLPDREAEMAARALLVSPDATLDADALRKADAVTLRRAGFAMLLGAIEQHAAHVDNKSWRVQRRQFYGLAQRHLLTPRGFFDYSSYFPRIIAVMVTCNDQYRAKRYILGLAKLVNVIRKTCKYRAQELNEYCRTMGDRIVESILQSRSVELKHAPVLPLIKLIKKHLAPTLVGLHTERNIRSLSKTLFFSDWSRRPYGVTWLESHASTSKIPDRPKSAEVCTFLKLDVFDVLKEASGVSISPYWPALAFPTRPISIGDVTAYAPKLLNNYSCLRTVIQALRGTWATEMSELKIENDSKLPELAAIPIKRKAPIRVAVTNFKTTDEEWSAAVKKKPSLGLERYRRVNRFINEILKKKEKVSHVLFPECSVPRRWARNISNKLSIQGVSFIGGLEYAHGATGLRNEAIVSLISDFPGYKTNIVILQPKLCPAWKEHKSLIKLSRRSLEKPPEHSLKLPIYAHGKFNFSVLICSDLTTLSNRSLLQGHIDCLFVPEWNPDIETFGTLIESSSTDLHAYLVQSNNRIYGDSRIRAPYKKNFKRDVVRVRGGLHDYFVIDVLDIKALRKFQAHKSPPDGEKEIFKPFPIGYNMSQARRPKRSTISPFH